MIASMASKRMAVAARSALHHQNTIAPPLVNYFSNATNPKQEDICLEDTTPTHFKQSSNRHALSIAGLRDDEIVWDNPVHHPVYDLDKIEKIDESHRKPKKMHERIARAATWTARSGFDFFTRYKGPGGEMKKEDWLRRCLFLETIAGVPGMVGGMLRHLRSLRAFRRDYGWIHTLLEEAENERMHLLIFMNMRQPGYLFRLNVLAAQGIFFNAFFLTYLVSPKTCHRFVGYLEEEAVHTYTGLLQDIHDGNLPEWNDEVAPKIARTYYKLPDDAKIVDMIKCIRADEANHRDVNHTFADLNQNTGVNPYMVKEMEKNQHGPVQA